MTGHVVPTAEQLERFVAMVASSGYQAIHGHRNAVLADSGLVRTSAMRAFRRA